MRDAEKVTRILQYAVDVGDDVTTVRFKAMKGKCKFFIAVTVFWQAVSKYVMPLRAITGHLLPHEIQKEEPIKY